MLPVSVTPVVKSRIGEIDFNDLPFGRNFSDHMFIADYINGQWQDCRVVPFGNIEVSPANMALHYGQSIFEGIKATLNEKGEPVVFRPDANLERLNKSAVRMAMPELPDDIFFAALDYLIAMDKEWFPKSEGSSLYIRPLMFAMDGSVGVRASESYRFIMMTGPTGPYYAKPVRLWVEEHYVRASRGGVGFAKTAGNYAASIMPAHKAHQEGYDQILWLDGLEYKYLQECGTMNIFVIIGDTILTPPTGDTILAGVTRDSLLKLFKEQGYKTEVRPIAISEIVEAYHNGTLKEVFGSGTAAVISHVSEIHYQGESMILAPIAERTIGPKMKAHFEDIKAGKVADTHHWLYSPKEVAVEV